MNDKDTFAVWIAEAMLHANGENFAAAALADLAQEAETAGDLDLALNAAASNTRRAGDFGVEFIGPLLPVFLVEFGRMLWEAYLKALAEQGGKALASVTIATIKELARHTWLHTQPVISLDDVEARLREAGSRAGIDKAHIDKLILSLRSPEMGHALAGN